MRRAIQNLLGAAAFLGFSVGSAAIAQPYPTYNHNPVQEPGGPGIRYPELRNPDARARSTLDAPSTPDTRVQGVQPAPGMAAPRNSAIGPAIEPIGQRDQASTPSQPPRTLRTPTPRPAFGDRPPPNATTGGATGAGTTAGPTSLTPPSGR